MGFSHVLRFCLQGGGVRINSGTVTFSSCTITGNTAGTYVRAHARKFPSPPWETHVLLVFTGRRCQCLFRHRHNDVLLDHRQHSFWIGACSCGNFPSPRWETADALASSLTCTTVADASMNYSEYVPQTPRKFPWPRWDFHMFCACACRAAVSMSRVAR